MGDFKTALNEAVAYKNLKIRIGLPRGCLTLFQPTKMLASPELAKDAPPLSSMISVLGLPKPDACFTQSGGMRQLRTKGKWEAAAKGAGKTKNEGTEAHAAVDALYQNCHAAYAALTSAAAGEVLARLASSSARWQ
jgi:hypothetical protein